MTFKKNILFGSAAFFLLFCGCSINQVGLPVLHSVQNYESATNLRTEIKAWGIHVSTHPTDGGVVIGYTRRNYIRPKPGADAADIFLGSDLDETDVWHPVQRLPETNRGANVVTDKSIGLSIRANRIGLSAGVGWRSTYLLEIDQNYEGAFFVNIKEND